MPAHSLIGAFKANKPAFGAWLTTPGIFHARTVAQASPHLSWIVVDCEHGLVPLLPGAAECITAIHGAVPNGAPSAIVRIPATGVSQSTSWQIKYALDAGARGVLVPMVSTAEKAQEIVADSRFPPAASVYLNSANENISVLVQIETREGVENVEQIAAVVGVDVLFIGPYDLSISLGYAPPSPDPHPDVEKVIQKILQATHNAGKKCAIYCSSGVQAAKRAAEGFDMINVTSDMGAMSDAIAAQLAIATK